MAEFTRVVDLVDAVEAFQLNQYAAALEGDAGAGRAITLTALNDVSAYALRVANQDTTNGRAFKVFKANLTDAWIDVTKTGTKVDGLQLIHQVSTPDAPGTGFTALYPKTDDLLYYRSESGSEIALADVSSVQTLSNKTVQFGDGTAAAPSVAFTNMTDAGLYRIGTDEFGLAIAGGDGAGGGTAIRFRKGNRWPQIAIGQVNSSGGWAWTDTFYDVPFKVHLVQDLTAGGSVIGSHVEVRNDAASGQGAGSVPDSSASTSVIYQHQSFANGATRAVEAQTIVGPEVSNAHANATSYAIEAGIHMGIAGNGAYKTGVINAVSTVNGIPNGPTGVVATSRQADVGLLLRGDAGYIWPIRFWDERVTGKFLFNVEQQGRVLGSYLGTSAQPSYSHINSAGAEDPTGLFLLAAGVLGFACGGAEQMRLSSGGIASGGGNIPGERLSLYGNATFRSNNDAATETLSLGRSATDGVIAILGTGGVYADEGTAGDLVIRAESGNDILFSNGADGNSVLRIGASKIGFFTTAPVSKASAYTQTYSSTTKTHSNLTSSTLSVSVGTGSTTIVDVSGSFNQTTLNNIVRSLADQINALRVDLTNAKQVVNSVLDDLQAYGLMADA
jgi:hypothetical protein